MSPCIEQDCDLPARTRGFCRNHYMVIWRQGDVQKRPYGTGPKHRDFVGVVSAHSRVRALWGRAREHPCAFCGGAASDWAYDGTDPSQQYERNRCSTVKKTKVFYSLFPEFYIPLCKKCHSKRDRTAVAIELEEYRTLKHATGLTYEEMAEKLGVQ